MEFRPNQIESLLETKNYRNFLGSAFIYAKENNPRFSLASFARTAGMTARSFPGDVVAGRKRLTLSSLGGFTHALKLKGDLKNFFGTLVAIEEQDISKGQNPELLKLKLEKLKNRVKTRLKEEQVGAKPETFHDKKYWPEVFASLGTTENGASLAEIVSRTKLTQSTCVEVISLMSEKGIVQVDPATQRYVPSSPHLILNALSENPFFKSWYLDAISAVKTKAATSFESKEELYFNSVFSISHAQQAQFRNELRQLMLKFVDHAENPNGDKLARLSIAFY